MKKAILLFLICCFCKVHANYMNAYSNKLQNDSVAQQNSANSIIQREFRENLNETYHGEDFTYVEKEYEPEKNEKVSDNSSEFLASIFKIVFFFLKYIFPILLVGLVLFLVLKFLFDFDFSLFSLKKSKIENSQKLVFENDADIHDTDLENLLQNAITNEEYRLAIRYYFLQLLKDLSNKKLIDYHKEKTNSEYLFELKNKQQQEDFSYLLYLYNYIWYGEFFIGKQEFQLAATKYQSFKNKLK
ncbi:hypothetical protein N9V96_02320 [Polaribacter sp.]|nr:hypothetical protein [Polaribacter sp.]